MHKNRLIIKIGTDVSSNYGIEGYMLHENEDINFMLSSQIFSKRFFIKHKKIHINVKKMMAIFHALNFFGPNKVGYRILLHCDNFPVTKGLKKSFIKKGAMKPLRAIMMKIALFDIVIKFIGISIKKNFLADLLFRGRFDKIVNFYSYLQISQTSKIRSQHDIMKCL